MKQIKLNRIEKKGNTLFFDYSVSDDLASFFSETPFVIEYPENVESVPDSIAAVPFVCNVLPVIWLTDTALIVKELDKAFYECIPDVRRGYETMFPESNFAGSVEVENVVSCERPASDKSAVFFSGGLDAVNTLVNHLEESPALISVWGADVHYENAEGWSVVHKGIEEYAQKYHLFDVVIRSSFRKFDKEGALDARFGKQLQDGWWHGVKHGLGLLGHAAPYAYLHGLSAVYIASTNCPADGPVRCASNPLTDNHVRFANAQVVHDGFEFSRQDKVSNVVDYVLRTGDQVSLHVCWETQSGGNCCKCEKCYRTIAGLIAEGVDPTPYGFEKAIDNLQYMQKYLIGQRKISPIQAKEYWSYIGSRMKENQEKVQRLPYWKEVKWLAKTDFMHPEKSLVSRERRIRGYLARFKFYQLLHELKKKL